MKFDFIIGNPPYQEDMDGTSDNPVYNDYMDAVYELADEVELISPARFLFNAGKTSKEWNRKMLDDPHLKALQYWSNSRDVFQGPDIKGGIVIIYRDSKKIIGPINSFVPYTELYSALQKVINNKFVPFSNIIYAPESYRISKKLHIDFPDAKNKLSKGHFFDLTTNIFEKLPEIFFAEVPNDNKEYIGIVGRENNVRITKYILKEYIEQHENLQKYKVFMAKSNGSGQLGQELSQMLIGKPGIGHNQTFISIGAFETQKEAENCLNYIKTRFARAMLGTLKVTQDNKKGVWKNVPIQDFTYNSKIDWSKSIPEIDSQLYAKYGLDEKEAFIESHVKEME